MPCREQLRWWLIERFVGELERAPVYRNHDRSSPSGAAGYQIQVASNRFLRIHVNGAHEPSRFIRTDRKQHDIERPAARCDHRVIWVIRGVASEVNGHDW